MSSSPRELFIVAGEPSGDTHAAHLLEALARRDPDLRVRGYGGPKMAAAGCELLHDLASEAIMGLFPVVAALPRILKLMRRAEEDLATRRPAALILVDYPGFNLRLAARAHRLGIPVIYYISPQVWAWARWRIKKMARIVDLMLVILPFEAPVYAGSGLETVYVGHPLMDHLRTVRPDPEVVAALRAGDHGGPLVGLFPGSRAHVTESLLPVFLDAARALTRRLGDRRPKFAVALAQERFRPLWEKQDRTGLDVELTVGRPYEVMEAADLCLTSSGTTTLEIAASLTPFVIGYRVSPVLYGLGRVLISVEHIGLVNLVAGKSLVPEHVGYRSFAEGAAEDLERLATDEAAREEQVAGLRAVRDTLDSEGSYERAAGEVVGFLERG